jgi:hypothetical protein
VKVGDLVKWSGRTSVQFPGPRTAIVLDEAPEHGRVGCRVYWHVFMEGRAICMDEAYLEVMHESR